MLDFNPKAVIYAPHHFMQVVVSDIGVFIWAAIVGYAISKFGFATVFRLYGLPYLWYVVVTWQLEF